MPTEDVLQQWLTELKEKSKLSEENFQALSTAITSNKEAQEFVTSNQLRQSEFSRRMNELDDNFKAKEAEIVSYQTSLAEWKGTAEAEYKQMQEQLREAQAERERLLDAATEYGVPGDQLRKVTTQVEKPQEKPEIDLSGYVKREDVQAEALQVLKLQQKLLSMANRHQELFGKPFIDEDIVDRAMNNRRTLDDEYEATYSARARREAVDTERREAEHQRIRDEERARVLSELKLPQARPEASASPLADVFKSENSATATTAEDRMGGISAAVAAWNERKYAPKS